MKFIAVVGISHQTASMDDLNRVCSHRGELQSCYGAFVAAGMECVFLSTCNRIEFYLASEQELQSRVLLQTVANFLGFELSLKFFCYMDKECLNYLFRVVSSLDSIVIGESQILAQIRKAYLESRESKVSGKFLNRLFESAVAFGKRVRTETTISRGAVSVSQAAVELSRKVFDNLKEVRAMVIGAGEMGILALRHLLASGFDHPILMNRSLAKAMAVSQDLRCEARALSQLEDSLNEVDLVLCAVSVTEPLIHQGMLNQVMKKRRYRSLFLVDISLPFSIGSDVSQIDSVYLYDIRDLRQVVDQNLALRNSQRLEIEHMIADSVAEYCHWLEQQEFSGVIEQMAKLRQTVVSTELDKFYSTTQEGRESAQRVADAVAAKFVHSLMLILKDRDLSAEAKRQLADKILSTLS